MRINQSVELVLFVFSLNKITSQCDISLSNNTMVINLHSLILLSLLSFLLQIGITQAQPADTAKYDKLVIEVSYTGDASYNFTGGVHKGFSYMGMANMQVSHATGEKGIFRNIRSHVHAINTHSKTRLSDLTGDLQVASNIEAGDHTFLQELWVKKKFNKLEVTAGLQDMNVEFANLEYAGLFVNSSFGVLPVITANMCAPVFPLTTPGITFKYELLQNTTWLFALYDGCPEGLSGYRGNARWRYYKGDGLLAISELQFSAERNGLTSSYEAGIFSINNITEDLLNIEFTDSLRKENAGIYLHTDHMLYKNGNNVVALFLQAGHSLTGASYVNKYLGAGLNYQGLFRKDGNDVLGLAIASAHLRHTQNTETAIELTYRSNITRHISVQPDIQYIINPSGTGTETPNALAGTLRFFIGF